MGPSWHPFQDAGRLQEPSAHQELSARQEPQEPLAQADAGQQALKAQAAHRSLSVPVAHRSLSAPVALGGRRRAAASAQAATSRVP